MAGKTGPRTKKAEAPKTATRSATKAAAAKTAAAKKPTGRAAARKVSKGDTLTCELCGLQLIVDETGDVLAGREVICCGQSMKEKPGRAKASSGKAKVTAK
ncbi:MAG: hypothetical protein PHU23_04230 [Dehalococcoidales bacterium]|nr:hypothetical protein [Dehalococcoidales bacterium]